MAKFMRIHSESNLDVVGMPHRRRRRLKYIAVLPSLVTLGNLVCGFAAIHFALRAMFAAGAGLVAPTGVTMDNHIVERLLPSFLAIGAMLVFAGMVLDMLDGLVARLTHKTSEFGAQVDSLADVVTFGVAPAILVIALMMREWHSEAVLVTPLSEQPLGRAMWVCAAAYCICTAVRLARFNVEHGQAGVNNRSFQGLPSPGAAAVVASLITLHEHGGLTIAGVNVVLYVLPIVVLGCGFLMISRIRYERITHLYLIGRRPFKHLPLVVALFVLFISYKAQTLAVLCCLYALSGPIMMLVTRYRDRANRLEPGHQATSERPAERPKTG